VCVCACACACACACVCVCVLVRGAYMFVLLYVNFVFVSFVSRYVCVSVCQLGQRIGVDEQQG
jgi:hypothetical protein